MSTYELSMYFNVRHMAFILCVTGGKIGFICKVYIIIDILQLATLLFA